MFTKERLEIIGRATALAALLFTAGSYVYNLYLNRAQSRYEAAIGLMERYRNDGIRAAELTLDQRMLYYRNFYPDLNDATAFPDPEFELMVRDVLFGFTGTEEVTAKPLLPDILRITDFYGEVRFCAQSSICDPDILDQYFCPRAAGFRDRYARLTAYYSDFSSSKDWINGLEQLVENCG